MRHMCAYRGGESTEMIKLIQFLTELIHLLAFILKLLNERIHFALLGEPSAVLHQVDVDVHSP